MFINRIRNEIKSYYKLLSPEYPLWLNEYIETKELLKQEYVNVNCGIVYSNLFNIEFVSSLEHSVAVALIIWNFTHDKIQTLAGLFHDIATPSFNHCIDFLNGDYMVQESTEDLTTEIIRNSEEIMSLLKRDNIKLEDVCNYHIYPICDNETPRLSADRLEYSLCHGFFTYKIFEFNDICEMYNDIEIQSNENGIIELGFKTKKIARNFVKMTSQLSVIYRSDKAKYSMQFIADIIKKLNEYGIIQKKDLYEKKETDIIDIILNSKYGDIFRKWQKAKKVKVSVLKPDGVYFVKIKTKLRYIDPLFKGIRISKCCKIAKKMIDKNLSFENEDYVYLDFNFS